MSLSAAAVCLINCVLPPTLAKLIGYGQRAFQTAFQTSTAWNCSFFWRGFPACKAGVFEQESPLLQIHTRVAPAVAMGCPSQLTAHVSDCLVLSAKNEVVAFMVIVRGIQTCGQLPLAVPAVFTCLASARSSCYMGWLSVRRTCCVQVSRAVSPVVADH